MTPRFAVYLGLLFLLSACQGLTPTPTRRSDTGIQAAHWQQPEPVRPTFSGLQKTTPQGEIRLQDGTLTLRVQLPPLSLPGFETQLLDLSAASKITASVTDSHGKIYYANGADASHQTPYPGTGIVALTFDNVIPDDLLLVEMQVVNTTPSDIPQADLAAVLKHTGISNPNTTINFQTTAVAKTIKALLASNAPRARAINLTDLNSLMATITGITGTAPNFSYAQNHPSLVKTATLATALVASNPPALTASAATYRGLGATVNLTVSGLVGSDKIQVQVTDAASAVRSNLGNGASSGNVQTLKSTPGSGIKLLVLPFGSPSVTYTYTLSPTGSLTLTEGGTQAVTITATPNITVSSFSPTAGPAGTSVIITGSGFTGASAVRFNGVDASGFTVNSDTQITASVPAGAIDGPISVVYGSSFNSASNFDVYRRIHVKANATGLNNGRTWDDAYTSLQSALSAAGAQDDIWIATGTYTPGLPTTNRFQMKSNVNLYGGFFGNETTLTARNPASNIVVLSGDLGGDDTGSGAAYTIVGSNSQTVIRGANSALLDGVTVRAGDGIDGGGMSNNSVSPTINNVIFENNRASTQGGGMFNNVNASPSLNQVIFRYNQQTGSGTGFGGGAMYNLYAYPSVTNSSFISNNSARGGGAVFNYESSPTFTNVTFTSNTALGIGGGGAMSNNFSGTVTVTGSNFILNSSGDNGGAIRNGSGVSLNLSQVNIKQNTSIGSGGGIFNNGICTLTDVVFEQNTASSGGGLFSQGGSAQATLSRVLFYNNSVTGSTVSAGGMNISSGSQASLSNVVFANNSASGTGSSAGGLLVTNTTANLQNVTFSNNTALTGGGISVSSSTLTMQNTLFWNSVQSGAPLGSGLGNVSASSDPFVNSALPLGADGIGMTSDDGLKLTSAAPGGVNGLLTGAPAMDILGIARNGNPEPGAYEYIEPPLPANVVVVKQDAVGSNNGTSWANAYTSLKTAMDNTTTAGKEIWVAAGTYTPGTTTTSRFQMQTGVSVYGGFAGTEYLRTDRNPASNIVVLSGDLDGDDTGSGAAYTIVGSNSQSSVIWGANSATLDGVTVRAGNAGAGAGMRNIAVSPTINNVIFENNYASGTGGGIYNSGSSPNLNQVIFRYNRQTGSGASNGGGAMYNTSASPSVSNSSFISNTSFRDGGAVSNNNNSSPTFTNVVFTSNTTSNIGGAMINKDSGTVTVTGSTFNLNSANAGGGGIVNYSNITLNLSQSHLKQNSATHNAGGIGNYGVCNLTDVVFDQNTVSGNTFAGGGLLSTGVSAQVNLTRVLFHNNSVTGSNAYGGGMINVGLSQASLSNVVFANNSASGSGSTGGGLYLVNAPASLQNVTFSNNTAPTDGGISVSGSTLTMQNTLFWNSVQSGAPLGSGLGNVSAGSDPFVNSALPLGADGIAMTSDDGLKLTSATPGGVTGLITGAPAMDILGIARNGNPEPGAYEF